MFFFFFDKDTKALDRSEIEDGQIVAFEHKFGRGVALMANGDYCHSAYNLLEPDKVVEDSFIPEEIQLLPPTKEDMVVAIDHLYGANEDSSPDQEDFWQNAKTVMKDIKDSIVLQEHIAQRLEEWYMKSLRDYAMLEKGYKLIDLELAQNIKMVDTLLEEAEEKDKRISELEEILKNTKTEDNFVQKFVKETEHFYKHDRKKADAIRQIMIKVGRSDADAELDAWIEGREKPLVNIEKAGDVINEGGKKYVKHYDKDR